MEICMKCGRCLRRWFGTDASNYNGFIKALLQGDLKAMNAYMNSVIKFMFSSLDGGSHPSGKANPERLYGVKATTSSFKDREKSKVTK